MKKKKQIINVHGSWYCSSHKCTEVQYNALVSTTMYNSKTSGNSRCRAVLLIIDY